ncbi:MAG: hydroxyacylglutathione hydrolase [Candidatus Methanomethylophilaceae archaeon]|nr:hydroxyacylglutathione hydrolase [Candidatus Methanomethylophilaceae archaeon]
MAFRVLTQILLFDSNKIFIEGDKPILVDTGTGFKVEETIAELHNVLSGRDLERIVLTHRHFDHVGGVKSIAEEFSAEVLMAPVDAEVLRKGDSESTLGTDFGGFIEPIEVTDLREGEVLSTGEHNIEVLFTPGHTAGSLCLYDRAAKALISGDTVFVGGIGRFDKPSASKKDLEESLRRLSDLSVEALYPGHGPCEQKDGIRHIRNGLKMLEGYP